MADAAVSSYTSNGNVFHYARLGPLALIVWGAPEVSNHSFLEHCHVFADSARRWGPPSVVLNHTASFRPNPTQRAMIRQHAAAMGVGGLERLALISSSALVRSAVTAIQWILPPRWETKLYGPTEIDPALEWLRANRSFDTSVAWAEMHRGLALVTPEEAAPQSQARLRHHEPTPTARRRG